MKKLLTLLLCFALVSAASWGAGTTTETSGKSTIQTGPASFTNFVQLGELATPLKFVTFTGTTAGSEGAQSGFTHGLGSASRILGLTVLVATSGYYISPGYTNGGEIEYMVITNDNTIQVILHNTNSGGILSCPMTALVWYKQ